MRAYLFVMLLLPLGAFAGDAGKGAPSAAKGGLQPPDLPAQVESGRALETTVHIRQGKEGEITEYRINGRAYMVKIQPQVGPPYYLIDRDGDGRFETQTDDPRDQPVPMWILFSW